MLQERSGTGKSDISFAAAMKSPYRGQGRYHNRARLMPSLQGGG